MFSGRRAERLIWLREAGARALPGSLRVRLTIWYGLLLAIVLLASLQVLSQLLERQLREDLDNRLQVTAAEVRAVVIDTASPNGIGASDVPDLTAFTLRGQLVQIIDAGGGIVAGSFGAQNALLPSRQAPGVAFANGNFGGQQFRTATIPIVLDGGEPRRIGAVVVGQSIESVDQTIGHVRRLLVAVALAGIAVATAGGWFLAGGALRPVEEMTVAATDIAGRAGSAAALEQRLTVPRRRDEVASLAVAFNRMLDHLEAAFARQRRFLADASHELRTPLTAIRSNAEVLLAQARDPAHPLDHQDLEEGLDGITRGTQRMGKLVNEMLDLARAEAGVRESEFGPVRLDDVAREAVESLRPIAGRRNLQIEATGETRVLGDSDRLHELVVILVDNAIRHTPEEGTIAVSVGALAGGRALLAVTDDGTGIAPEDQPYVFDRFFRSDRSRQRGSGGTGLGLAIAKAIIEAHGGSVELVSAKDGGTTFIVTFPELV